MYRVNKEQVESSRRLDVADGNCGSKDSDPEVPFPIESPPDSNTPSTFDDNINDPVNQAPHYDNQVGTVCTNFRAFSGFYWLRIKYVPS